MERGSSRHGPRLDDELARQARSYTQGRSPGSARVDDEREQEPAGEDQPEPSLIPRGPRPGGAPEPMTGEDVEARSRLGRAVPRSVLPAGRAELVRAARQMDAPLDILADLESLPADRVYATVYEIWDALGYRQEG